MLGSFTAGPTTLAKDQDWQAVLMGAGGLLGGVSAHLHNDAGSRSVKTVRDATFTCLNVRHAPSLFLRQRPPPRARARSQRSEWSH